MFISVLDLFKIGLGPSSSHTMGPMVAARDFAKRAQDLLATGIQPAPLRIRCTLRGSLAFTGKGHGTDCAVALGLHGYSPEALIEKDVLLLSESIWTLDSLRIDGGQQIRFSPQDDILFDKSEALPDHPNGLVFQLRSETGDVLLSETYFSIGGGFISTLDEIHHLDAPLKMRDAVPCPYPFDSANSMLQMATESGLSIASMKRENELARMPEQELVAGLQRIRRSMRGCVERGLTTEGTLPGSIQLPRRAKMLHDILLIRPHEASLTDWLCAYAMAVAEENAAGHMVVTAPTNGAAGVIPAILYYFEKLEGGTHEQIDKSLLTAAALGGIIKHRSSISGAAVGCQGEIGSAASMAAAGLCAAKGGTPAQIENAAEIALEHHLGMTCDPVDGLVQVPCIERNAFGAVKAYTAASLALRGTGKHFMPLDNCIAAMKQTGLEMSNKYKETSLGGLAVNLTEC